MTTETLWLAPTRPAMKSGVTGEAFFFNMLGTMAFGIVMGSPLWWFAGVAIHYGPMRWLTAWDVNFFRVLRLWMVTKGESMGVDLYGAPALYPMLSRKAETAGELQTCV
jgi:type IV secretion system protein VirB3